MPIRDDTAAIVRDFDLRNLPAGFSDDPYPVYRALQTHDPVHLCPDGSYFLTRYNDLMRVYRDAKTYSSDKKREFRPKFGDSPLFTHHTTSLVFSDPPLHTHVRKLIISALTPRTIAKMEQAIIELIDMLLNRAEDAGGKIDLINDFASAIPVEVIGNLLAIPHEDRDPLRDWSLAILGALEPALTVEQMERGNKAVTEFSDYLRTLIANRRNTPGDIEFDVLTRLIEGKNDGRCLSETELIQNCIFILNAGHETTTNLIGNGLHALLMHPVQRRRLIDQPSLINTAVEEFLRFESSNQLGNRISTNASEIGNVQIPPHTSITLCIAAANRDPSAFKNPDHMDIARRPNKHLAFGNGAHTCAGSTLARMEGSIAIGRLVKRFPNYSLRGKATRSARVRFRGFTSVPVHLN